MPYYITYGDFQKQMTHYYHQTGHRMQFDEMTDYLFRKNLLKHEIDIPDFHNHFDHISDEAFEEIVDSFILSLTPASTSTSSVLEGDIIPPGRDAFIIRHPRFTRPRPHTHNFFEINYVVKGSCQFNFENKVTTLQEGEIFIIAPFSVHDVLVEDESIIYTILIRRSTFDTTFLSLLSGKDLLSYFFRKILQDDSTPNYLSFKIGTCNELKPYIRNAMIECQRHDDYSNQCCTNWINLLFSNLLRHYSESIQFHNYQISSDFSVILLYIQKNYQNLSLSELAEKFHYSEPYLSTIIKENTGYKFTDLIKRLRMAHAIEYLKNSDQKISEISALVGYNSTDHFSRVFRSTYKLSPAQYRKKIRSVEN